MKILVLGSRIPYPLHDGGAIATFNMLKCMAEEGHAVVFFSFNTKKHFVSEETIRTALPFCRTISSPLDTSLHPFRALLSLLGSGSYNMERFRSATAEKQLVELLQNESFDIVHFEGLYTVYLLDAVKENFKGPVVLRQHNVEFKIWETLAGAETSWIKKKYLRLLASRLKRFESSILTHFRAIVTISPSDAAVFSEISPGVQQFLYPAGFYFPDGETPDSTEPHSLSHIGSMEWMPNVQGVQWLVDQVMPKVLEKFPDALLHIAGKGLDARDPAFRKPFVVNHGEVEDSAKFITQYKVMCVPLKSGSGLRMKTVEAMSLKRAVVSTGVGADGLNAETQDCLSIADTAEGFAAAICSLFNENGKQGKIEKGYKAVFKSYSAQSNTRELLEFYKSLAG